MFVLIKKMSTVLLIIIVNGSYSTKGVSLSNKIYMSQPALINLHPNKYSQ